MPFAKASRFLFLRPLAVWLLTLSIATVSAAQSVSSVSLSKSTIPGGESVTGTIHLSSKAPISGITVILSSDSSDVTVPSSVIVYSGEDKATFYVSSEGVVSKETVKITATGGGKTRSVSLTIDPATLSGLSLSPTSVVGGDASIGTVTIDGIAPSTGLAVNLKASGKDATVPISVVIPAGGASADFLVATTGISSKTSSTITAKLGSEKKTASLTITPAELGNLTLSPNSVLGGSSSTAVVSLTGSAPAKGITISITDDNPGISGVPKSVVIPAGSSSASFPISTNFVTTSSTAVIAVSTKDVGLSQSLEVLADQVQGISVSPSTIVGGTSTTGTITLSASAPLGGCPVSLFSSSTSASVPSTVTVPAGSTSATFTISTATVATSTSATITAKFGGSSATCSLNLSVSNVLANSAWPKYHGNNQNTGLGYGSGAQGTLLWNYATSSIIGAGCPAIAVDGTVYIGSWDHNLYALSTSGAVKWQYTTGNNVLSSPAVGSDGAVYFGSTDNYLYALNSDGSLRWKFLSGGFGNSSPAIGLDGTIYIGSYDNNLYAVNPNGSLKWSFNAGNSIDSSPAIGPDGTIYIGSTDNILYAVNSDGTLKWAHLTGNAIFSSPAVGTDGTVYVGSQDSYVYAINPNGTEKWTFQTGGYVWSSPALGADGTVYVGSTDDSLYAISSTGTLKWKYTTGAAILNASPVIGSDGTVYVGSRDNYLYALTAGGTLKWRFLTGSWIDSSPAIGLDGTIYVGSNDNNIYAIH